MGEQCQGEREQRGTQGWAGGTGLSGEEEERGGGRLRVQPGQRGRGQQWGDRGTRSSSGQGRLDPPSSQADTRLALLQNVQKRQKRGKKNKKRREK